MINEELERPYSWYEEYRNNIYDLLGRCDWQWFATMNVDRYDIPSVNEQIRDYLRHLSIKEHIQVGAQGVINSLPHPHVHLLMLGDSITGRSLLNAKPEVWKHVWFKKMHRGCVINKVTNVEGVVGYVSFHNTPAERFELVNPYNTKLLKRMAAGRQNPSIKMKRVYPINDYRAWAKYEARGVN